MECLELWYIGVRTKDADELGIGDTVKERKDGIATFHRVQSAFVSFKLETRTALMRRLNIRHSPVNKL